MSRNDEIAQIVEAVLERLSLSQPGHVVPPRLGGGGQQVSGLLVLTDELDYVKRRLEDVGRRQRLALSVLVGGTRIRRGAASDFGEVFYADEPRHRAIDFVDRFDHFYLAGVQLITIARLSQMVCTELVESVAFDALARGKAVMLEPAADRNQFAELPVALRSELDRLAGRLVSFGVTERSIVSLFGVSPHDQSGVAGASKVAVSAPSATSSQSVSQTGGGRATILTVQDVRDNLGPGNELRVHEDYRLTDLAREYVTQHGVTIRAVGTGE